MLSIFRKTLSRFFSCFRSVSVMPQPLSKVRSDASIILGNSGDYPLEQRPDLLPHAMRVVAAWSTLESFMGSAIVNILGAHAGPGIAMYTSLTSNAAKMGALRAAGDVIITGKQNDLFHALLVVFNSLATRRNKIVHGVWGYSPEVPDGVLLAHQSVLVNWTMELERFLESTPSENNQMPVIDKAKIFVYKATDFKALIKDIEMLSGAFLQYQHLPDRHRAHRSDQVYDQLSREPLIREALNRRKNRDKSSPKGKK